MWRTPSDSITAPGLTYRSLGKPAVFVETTGSGSKTKWAPSVGDGVAVAEGGFVGAGLGAGGTEPVPDDEHDATITRLAIPAIHLREALIRGVFTTDEKSQRRLTTFFVNSCRGRDTIPP
jgi:hypothetical protein